MAGTMEARVSRRDNRSWRIHAVGLPFLLFFCAKGAGSFQLGATPQGKVILPKTSAENANQTVAFALIPNMAFVEFDDVFAQKVRYSS